MSRADALRAELEAAEFEDELIRLKGLKRPDETKLRETKNALRDARQRYRAARSGDPAEPGDAVATPATVEATARTSDLGGDN